MASTVQARLDEESQEALKTLTQKLGMSPSEVVRASLRLMVQQHTDAKPKRRKLIGVGAFDSGVDDLATNKKYLEDLGVKSMGRR